ncbi:glycosyltransferase [Prosthecobacter sp.]|uniref:glycosyltransferase family 2 protein n=1 Tax=Prosthecobacter sp. TaxID=1965333 RepID=UPI001DB22F07|nr:glycosyltransferase [Prosthecobacter sp.]MCB1277984.1 glycosyltransferase family 2 protein [Prosthecobacter sp.]
MSREISALIICGDRLDEVTRCLESLGKLGDLLHEVLLLKNAPKHPWRDNCFESVPSRVSNRLHIISSEEQVFPTTGRNRLAAQATGSVYLFLDDDSLVLERAGIEKGLRILQGDPKIGSIAFPQSTEAGELAPFAQPAPVEHECFTCGFMTCAAMTRADVYHQIGGFQELLQMAHEENEFCKRQWDAGFAVLYLPERSICHNPSPNARNSRQRAMLNARNIWYQAVLHEPLWLLTVTLLPRLIQAARYLRGSREWTGGNWGSLYLQALKNFIADLPALLRERTPLAAATMLRWQQMKKKYPRYVAA